MINYSVFSAHKPNYHDVAQGETLEECQVNGIAEPFILLSYALTCKQRIKHVHVLGIDVFSCTVNVSDEASGLRLGLAPPRNAGTQLEKVGALSSRVFRVAACLPLKSIIPVHHFCNVSYGKKKKKKETPLTK